MELKGAKINFLGDSITEGCGVVDQNNNFINRIIKREGLAVGRNYGVGGTRIANRKEPFNPVMDEYFELRAKRMDLDADAVVVFGGTNDFGHGDALMGTFSDRTPDTFYGALHSLFVTLITMYPGKPIVVMTPTHRGNEDDVFGDGYRKYEMTLKGFVDAIKEVAEYYSLPVLDLYAVSGMQPKVDVIREKFMPDCLHPNDAGHEIIADRLIGFLKTL